MSQSSKDQDQSMEEILQSIKRIIAEEDEAPALGSDVLELTEILEEELQPLAESSSATDDGSDDLSALTMDEIMALRKAEADAILEAKKVAEVPKPARAPKPTPVPVALSDLEPNADDEQLISPETFEAAAAAFDELKNLPDPLPAVPHLDSMGMRSGTTVEDLVLEALRPMLREWLDNNLSEIVKNLVEREVRKITAR